MDLVIAGAWDVELEVSVIAVSAPVHWVAQVSDLCLFGEGCHYRRVEPTVLGLPMQH